MRTSGRIVSFLVLGLALFIGFAGGARAQSYASADCMIALLGKPLGSDSVHQALGKMGIIYLKEKASLPIISLPKQGVLLKIKDGLLSEIVLFNDSIPYQGQVYNKFKGAVPFGLAWADSLGQEENLLFQQSATSYGQNSDGISYASTLTASGGKAYYLQQGYLPAQSYFYYKRKYPATHLHRNLYYRFVWQRKPRGRYLNLPLACGSSAGGPFSTGVFANSADSAWYISLKGGYRNLTRGRGIQAALGDGAYFGLELLFPFNSRISGPMHQVAGFEVASFTYKDSISTLRTIQNNVPSQSQVSLYYGFAYMPTLKGLPGWRPIAQGIGGVQFDAGPELVLYNNVPIVKARSTSFFYQMGLGVGYQFASGVQLQLIGHYRVTRFARYLRYNTQAYDRRNNTFYPNLEVYGTKLGMVSVEACLRVNLGVL